LPSGRAKSAEAAWDSRDATGGQVTLRGIPESWTTVDALVALRGPAGTAWLAVRSVPRQTAY